MPIYQINDYTLLQIKEKTLSINLVQRWIKHELYTHINGKKTYIYMYIYTHKKLSEKIISKK